MASIKQIFAREILDSRGNPTVSVRVVLNDGIDAEASIPSGASKSSYEAFELRDNDLQRYNGQGVLKVVDSITTTIAPKIIGMDVTAQQQIDRTLLELDGTRAKTKLGANATLPISIAVAKAAAKSAFVPLFVYLRNFIQKDRTTLRIPTPAFNIFNGGLHANNNINFQEIMIIPASNKTYAESLHMGVTVYNQLKEELKKSSQTTLTGDEGGFAPVLDTNEDAFTLISQAIDHSSMRLGYDIFTGLDAASNHFYLDEHYKLKDKASAVVAADLLLLYEEIVKKYHCIYLEDPLQEDDWEGWSALYPKLSPKALIVGDDLTATNPFRLQLALSKNAINGIVIKPNQIGTVIETLAVVEIARHLGMKVIVSARSGETTDDFIADFAVAVGADYVKFGAPARGERIAKYNRLLQIDEQLRAASRT